VIETKGLKPIQDSGISPPFPHGPGHEKTRGKADPAALTKLIQKKLRS
jgi:hypothetical protein